MSAVRTHTDREDTVPTPLLLVGHGTVDEDGVREFTSFRDRVRDRLSGNGISVAGGFIELSWPTVGEAWDELVTEGHRGMAAVPLVLVAAGHGKGDIPAALHREVRRHPGSSFVFGRPLGPHPLLLDLLAERIAAVCPESAWPETTVLLVGRGSTDPDANAEVCKMSRLLQETRGFAGVETAFVSLAAPDVPAGLHRVRTLGAGRVVVAPYFLFTGVLPRRVVAQSLAFGRDHPDLAVHVAGHLGDCAGLADLVELRYREALAGDIRMNCDTCVYRAPLPGFGHRVGQPQTPHHHPADHDHHDHDDGGHRHADAAGSAEAFRDGAGHSSGAWPPGSGHAHGHAR